MFGNFAFFDFGPSEAILLLVFLGVFIFEIVMFVSVIRNKQITDNARILWAVGMLLVHPFVAIAYYFTDYKKAS